MKTDDYSSSDKNPSISAIGEAILALDKELEALADQDEILMVKRLHIHQKMKLCTEAIKKLLVKANNGVYPPPCPVMRFPELNMID
jgi:hypothetical protein